MTTFRFHTVFFLTFFLCACQSTPEMEKTELPNETQTSRKTDTGITDIESTIDTTKRNKEVIKLTAPQAKPLIDSPADKTAAEHSKTESELNANVTQGVSDPAVQLCVEIGNKLGSVSVEDCLSQHLKHSAFTQESRSLAYLDYPPLGSKKPLGRVLLIGGIHGDEFSSVSIIFKWMNILNQFHSGLFHWRIVPTLNPDGLLQRKSQRQNSQGVDLNRNFPTADWDLKALQYWEQKTHKNVRRFPGLSKSSELETTWLVKQISEFNPDVILSIHAPYHLVDYDGPPSAPTELGGLSLRKLGVFPGSLGNYAGIDLNIPIVTAELHSAGIMPANAEINDMWADLVRWLRTQLTP